MFFDGFYTCLYEVHKAAAEETLSPECYSEAVNDLFLFLGERQSQSFPAQLYDRAVRIFRHYLGDVLPELGCSQKDCAEIYDQYETLIGELEAASLASEAFEKACSPLIRSIRNNALQYEYDLIDALSGLARRFYGIQSDGLSEKVSQTFRREFPRVPGPTPHTQIQNLLARFVTTISDARTDTPSGYRTVLANFREMFEFFLLCHFGAKAVLIEETGCEGVVVPLCVSVKFDRAHGKVEFRHHDIDRDMQRSAATARSIARRYLHQKFNQNLPEQFGVCCQFLHPTIGYRDSSASLLIALSIVGKALELEFQPDTAVTGALDSSGHITAVGWVLQKLEASGNAGHIRRILVPASDTQAVERYENRCSDAQCLPIFPVRTFEEAVELYYGKEQLLARQHHADWGESPDVPFFFGRTRELRQLEQWIVRDRCRAVAIVGIKGAGKTRLSLNLRQGGIGKTDLSLTLARNIQGAFRYVIWRSLLNAPPLKELLAELIEFLSGRQEVHLPETPRQQISRLLHYLKAQRCLIILDNAETILQGGARAGEYRKGYEDYGLFFNTVGDVTHQSCLLLTTRETPKDIAGLAGKGHPVRCLHLGGLHDDDVKRLFSEIGSFSASDDVWKKLAQRYSGNPLALELAARRILSRFDGNIADFLCRELAVFENLTELLHWHIERLSERERELVYWFAIERDPVSPAELQEDVVSPEAKADVSLTLESLKTRLPLEKSPAGFTLQPVLIEYITKHFIERICREILSGDLTLFHSHALLKASAKEYIRDIQQRLFVTPIVSSWSPVNLQEELKRLLAILQEESLEESSNVVPDAIRHLLSAFQEKLAHISESHNTLETQLLHLLSNLRKHHAGRPGYAAGNILNLLSQLQGELHECDFSGLAVWQGHLQNRKARDINFENVHFRHTVFTEAFGQVFSLDFSPDGTLLAAGMADGTIQVWRVSDLARLVVCSGHRDWLRSLAFSPDGKTLVSGSYDQTIKRWDVETGRCLATLKDHIERVASVAFSPEGDIFASGGQDRTVRLWRLADNACLTTLKGHQGWVHALAFHPAGEVFVSGDTEGVVRVWDRKTYTCLNTFELNGENLSADFSPDGTLLALSGDRDAYIWDSQHWKCLRVLKGHDSTMTSVAFHPSGHLLAGSSRDCTIRLWDAHTGQLQHVLQGHSLGVYPLAFHPSGSFLASGSIDQTVKLWDSETARQIHTLQGHSSRIHSMAVDSKEKILVCGGEDLVVHVWDLPSRTYRYSLTGHTAWLSSLVFQPETRLLASAGADRSVRLWDCATGKCLNVLQGHSHTIRKLSFPSSGEVLASGSEDGTVRVWDVSTGECLAVFDFLPFKTFVSSLEFSPDGSLLAVSCEEMPIFLMDMHTKEMCAHLEGHSAMVVTLAFRADGRLLASAGKDRTIRIWDIESRECLKVLEGHADQILSVQFHPNDRLIASAGVDRTVRLWDIETGECLNVLSGHADTLWSVLFLADGQTLLSGGYDETIGFWDIQHAERLNAVKVPGPYQGMNIRGATGLTEAQKETLKALGAID